MKKFKNSYEYFRFIKQITEKRMKERNADWLERSMGLCGDERREELLKAGYDPEEPFIRFRLKSGLNATIDSIIYDNDGNGYRVLDIDYDYVICRLELWNHMKKNYSEEEVNKIHRFDVNQIKQMCETCKNWE